MKTTDYREHLKEVFRSEETQADYLTACLEQGTQGTDPLTLALSDVARVREVRHTEFYLSQMAAILRLSDKFIKHLGFKLTIQKIDP